MIDFLGIDFTSSERRPSACVGLDGGLGLAFFGFLAQDMEIIEIVEGHHPRVVALDSPLALPLGLCCLEETCPCQPALPLKGRSGERELAKLGFPCYFTTKRSIIREMVYRGLELSARLRAEGCEVIEVYPYASKVRLWGQRPPPKTTPEGLAFLKERLPELMPCLAPHIEHVGHDLADAAVAAYTAYLYFQGRTQPLGRVEDGLIYIPGFADLTGGEKVV